MRAERLLREKLQSSRRDGLARTLATVQPTQYSLITRPRRSNVIIQGNPGTGKTLIAGYRLAYLLGDGTPNPMDPPVRSVLFLGPSEEYCKKIDQMAAELGLDAGYRVMPSARFLEDLRGGAVEVVTGEAKQDDASEGLAALVEQAARRVQELGWPVNSDDARRAVYGQLSNIRAATSRKLARWLKGLPSYEESIRSRACQHLHEYIGAVVNRALGSANPFASYEHVIVDEAQDLNPLQWQALVRACGGARWTVLGDIAQRRDRFGLVGWEPVAALIARASGVECQVGEVVVGYRSTRQILGYAARALPGGRRRIYSVQEGPLPTIQKVSPGRIVSEIARQAAQLRERNPQGTIAVIARHDRSIRNALAEAGWRHLGGSRWSDRSVVLEVLPAYAARGLEFDAVIVVEPKALLDGKEAGLLYSALTRANRELVVLHSDRLPRALRV